MTPKEKAKDIFDRYYQTINPTTDNNDIWIFTYTMKELAKKSSIIAVDEILNHHSQEQSLYRIDTYYWQQVKKEIEKL
jgi:hypothetical protein